jgi:hypothetical protein
MAIDKQVETGLNANGLGRFMLDGANCTLHFATHSLTDPLADLPG